MMRLLDVRFNSPSELHAVFGFSQARAADAALTISLEAEGFDRDKVFDEIMKIVEVVRYCHDYEHCSECSWRQFLAIVSRCRDSLPIASRSNAITVNIRGHLIEGVAAEKLSMEKNLFCTEAGRRDGLPQAGRTLSN